MSDGILKKTEILANVAIIVVALLLGGVLVKRYLWPGGGAAPARPDPRVPAGSRAALPGVDWEKNGRTLLLVLSRDCRYCTESAPFYRRLTHETAGRPGLRLIALFPQEVAEGRKYLDDLGVSVDEVRQASPDSAGAAATPTLILVDGGGVVKHSWVGKLAPPEESEVLRQSAGDAAGGNGPG